MRIKGSVVVLNGFRRKWLLHGEFLTCTAGEVGSPGVRELLFPDWFASSVTGPPGGGSPSHQEKSAAGAAVLPGGRRPRTAHTQGPPRPTASWGRTERPRTSTPAGRVVVHTGPTRRLVIGQPQPRMRRCHLGVPHMPRPRHPEADVQLPLRRAALHVRIRARASPVPGLPGVWPGRGRRRS